jgi:hypothetical protein
MFLCVDEGLPYLTLLFRQIMSQTVVSVLLMALVLIHYFRAAVAARLNISDQSRQTCHLLVLLACALAAPFYRLFCIPLAVATDRYCSSSLIRHAPLDLTVYDYSVEQVIPAANNYD